MNSGQQPTVTQAIILAAGRGERLSVLTALRPKVMLPVGNKPIVEFVIEALAANGIRDIVLVVGYQREMVQDYLGSGERMGVTLQYVVQENQLGTGHALDAAQETAAQHFLVLPGDNIISAAAIGELARSTENAILVTDQARGDQHGVVEVQNDMATNLVESPEEQASPWINTGVYSLTREIFSYLSEELSLPDAINKMIKDGNQFSACKTTADWWDAVYPWDLLRLNGLALSSIKGECNGQCEPGVTLKGEVRIERGSVVRSNSYIIGPVIIGEGCEVGPGVVIFPYTSIGNNVVIEAYSQLRNCIVGDSVQIGSHSHLTDTIIGESTSMGPFLSAMSDNANINMNGIHVEARCGSLISANVRIGTRVTLRPGTMIGHGADISDMKLIQDAIPESTRVL